MKTAFTIRYPDKDSKIRRYFDEKADKIEQYLKRFKSDLIHLHGTLEKNPHKDEFYASLILNLPTATLHCKEQGSDYSTAMNFAFLDLIRRIKKHKDKINREKRRLRKHPLKNRYT